MIVVCVINLGGLIGMGHPGKQHSNDKSSFGVLMCVYVM